MPSSSHPNLLVESSDFQTSQKLLFVCGAPSPTFSLQLQLFLRFPGLQAASPLLVSLLQAHFPVPFLSSARQATLLLLFRERLHRVPSPFKDPLAPWPEQDQSKRI